MIRIPTAAALLILCAPLAAQAPQAMSYQAVLRDANGVLLTNVDVGVRISILQGDENGPVVYSETHAPSTNINGLVTLEVGRGNALEGSFAAIDWSEGPYLLRTGTDPDGGTEYSITGIAPLLSVPYALYAANSEPGPQGPQGAAGTSDCPMIRTADGRAVVHTASAAHGLGPSATGGTQWYTTTLDGEVLGSIASDSAVVIYTASTAYGFAKSSTGGSLWASTTLNGPPVGVVSAMDRIAVHTEVAAYGFGRASTGSTNWSTTNISGPVIDHVIGGDRIVLVTSTHAYGYAKNAIGGSAWSPILLGSEPIGGTGTR